MPRLVPTLTGARFALPWPEQSFMVKSVGVSGASNEEDRIETQDESRPAINRCSDISQLTFAIGP
jgi:hypothetical protein